MLGSIFYLKNLLVAMGHNPSVVTVVGTVTT
jgi:hypothetical protein